MNLIILENKIGYSFGNKALLETALTHSSYYRGKATSNGRDNERLEFLGDAFLDAVIGDALYRMNPEGEEGQLSKLRALVVCENALSKVARELELGEDMRMSHGEEQSGGRHRDSILADGMEAIIGAVYLDGGFGAAQKMILGLFAKTLEDAMAGKLHSDYKSEFQEMIQLRRAGDNIRYVQAGSQGPDHDKTFFVNLMVNETVVGKGSGKSKKEAEQNAARQAIQQRQRESSVCTSKE